MAAQSFSIKNLYKSNSHLPKKHNKIDIQRACKTVSKEVQEGEFNWGPLHQGTANGKKVYFFKDLPSVVASNHISKNIRRAYDIHPPTRHLITKQIHNLLKETTPFHVLKFDIKSFFETANAESVLRKIHTDLHLSILSRNLLTDLINITNSQVHQGLPRGLPISSALSEVIMRDFDIDLRKTPGVYYYARFVDDLIVFSTGNEIEIINKVHTLAKKTGISLNEGKQTHIKTTKKRTDGNQKSKPQQPEEKTLKLTHLGYEYSFNPDPNKNKKQPRSVDIDIAGQKINKTKTRLVKAFLDHTKNRDYKLLKKRLEFLTGCYPIRENMSGGTLFSGKRFTYPLLTRPDSLQQLDNFKSKLIYSKSNSFGNRINSSLTKQQKRELAKISFSTGYKLKIKHNFSYREIKKIQECFER